MDDSDAHTAAASSTMVAVSSSSSAMEISENRLLSPQQVTQGLAEANPTEFARWIQREHGMEQDSGNRLLAAALPFMDALEVSRSELTRSLLQNLVTHLMLQIPKLTILNNNNGTNEEDNTGNGRDRSRLGDVEKMTELLRRSLPHLGVPELREIPLKLLALHLDPPPDILPIAVEYGGPALLDELPEEVRERLLISHPDFFENSKIRILISRYLAFDADIFSPAEEMVHHVDKKYRSHVGPIIQPFVEAIGKSTALFKRTIDVIREEYKSSRDSRLCTLRSDLIMTFHDLAATVDKKKYQAILETDGCYRLAYFLDTFAKQRAPLPDLEKRLDTIYLELVKLDPLLSFTPLAQASIDQKPSKKRSSQDISKSSEITISAQLKAPQSQQNVMYNYFRTCLDKAKDSDPTHLFDKPVIEQYPAIAGHYKSLVSRPMDITTMRNKLKDKKYKSFEDIRGDLRLIFDNCILYNREQYRQQAQSFLSKSLKECGLVEQEYINSRRQVQVPSGATSATPSTVPDHVDETQPSHDMTAQDFAVIDAAMMLADNKIVNALIRSLLICVQREVIEREKLPREVPVIRSLLHLIVIGECAGRLASVDEQNSASAPTKHAQQSHLVVFPKYGKEFEDSLRLERDFLPELILLRLHTSNQPRNSGQVGNTNENEAINDEAYDNSTLFQMVTNSFLARHILFHLFCDTLRASSPRRDHGELAHAIFGMCEAMAVKPLLVAEHPGFLLSLASTLSTEHQTPYQQQQQQQQVAERRPSVQPAQQASSTSEQGPNAVTRLRLLRGIVLPSLEAISLTSPVISLLAHAHEQFARVMNSPNTRAELEKNDYIEILMKGFSLMASEPDAAELSHGVDANHEQPSIPVATKGELIAAKYLSPSFTNARQLYEAIFASGPAGVRSFCDAPPEELVKNLSMSGPQPRFTHGGSAGVSPSPSPGISPGVLMSSA